MRFAATLSLLCLGPALANAGEATSAYSKFDLDTCRIVEKGDDFTYAGTWACKGLGSLDIIQAVSDDRAYVAFGRDGRKHCAFRKTFYGLNSALSPVEWRIRDGKPFAAIERWSVVSGEDGVASTWLVVTALRKGQSCHVHYIAGSYPDANAHAREAADDLAPDFDCERDMATVDSRVGLPPIDMTPCGELAKQ